MFVVVAAGLLLAGLQNAPAQPASSVACRWLTPDEATAVLGPGVMLRMAVEDGACVYERGVLRLQIAQPARMADARALRLGYDSMKQDRRGDDEPGIGEAAFVAANRREIAFLKGDAFVVVTILGDGAAERLPALKEAARRIAERF